MKQALETVCKELPSAISVPCEAFVQEYGDNIVDFIVSELNATEICTLIKLCKATKKPVSAVSVVMSPFDTLPLVEIPKDKGGKLSHVSSKSLSKSMRYNISQLSPRKRKCTADLYHIDCNCMGRYCIDFLYFCISQIKESDVLGFLDMKSLLMQ